MVLGILSLHLGLPMQYLALCKLVPKKMYSVSGASGNCVGHNQLLATQ